MEQTLHIPFFPLNIFLLPGEQLPLHIFEPRYRQLFEEAEELDIQFGLPYEDADLNEGFVSICRLVKVAKRYESGESDVIIEAVGVAKAQRFESVFPDKLYPGGIVEQYSYEHLKSRPNDELIELFREFVFLKYGTRPNMENVGHYRMIDLAASASLSNSDKVKLLMMKDQEEQENYLIQSLKYLNLLLVQEKGVENGIILN